MKNHCPFGLPVSAHNIEAKWTNDGHTGVALRFGQTGANIASHRTVAHKVTEKNMIKWTIVSHLGQAPHRRQTTDDGHDVWPAGTRAKWIRWLVQSAATAIYPIKWRRSNSTTREEATQKNPQTWQSNGRKQGCSPLFPCSRLVGMCFFLLSCFPSKGKPSSSGSTVTHAAKRFRLAAGKNLSNALRRITCR